MEYDKVWLDAQYHPQQWAMVELFVCEGGAVIQSIWGYAPLEALKTIEESVSENEAIGISIEDSFTLMIQIIGYNEPQIGEYGRIEMNGYWDYRELWRITYQEEKALDQLQSYLIQFDHDKDAVIDEIGEIWW